jgi:hypothetical protein
MDEVRTTAGFQSLVFDPPFANCRLPLPFPCVPSAFRLPCFLNLIPAQASSILKKTMSPAFLPLPAHLFFENSLSVPVDKMLRNKPGENPGANAPSGFPREFKMANSPMGSSDLGSYKSKRNSLNQGTCSKVPKPSGSPASTFTAQTSLEERRVLCRS